MRYAESQHRLGLDRHFQAAVAARAKDIVRFDDLIERETMREQRQRVEPVRLHHQHEAAHPFLPAGTKRGHDFVIADAGSESVVRNLKFSRVNTEAAQRAARTQAAESILKRLPGVRALRSPRRRRRR